MTRKLTYLTIFLGSFLLFGVQPMVGSTLLPVFGGTASVWTVCLAAFQTLLLAGYYYAHLVADGATARGRSVLRNAVWHVGLLAVAVVATAGVAAMRRHLLGLVGTQGAPILTVLLCVVVLAGLPYTLLSANASLVQAWSAALPDSGGQERDVYRLYAVSNLGSFCGLLAYPLLVEPRLALSAQWWGFAAGLGLYTAFLAVYAARLWRLGAGAPSLSDVSVPSDSPAHAWLWLALPAGSCFTLNAVTAHLCNDLTPLPLLWAVLLALFLLSYVVGFAGIGQRALAWMPYVLLPLLFWAAWQWGVPSSRGFALDAVLGMLLILLGGILLHAWLYQIRPDAECLTTYYLYIAVGGAVGGLCASVLAPIIFRSIAEYPLCLLALAAAAGWRICCGWTTATRPHVAKAGATVVIIPLLLLLLVRSQNKAGTVVKRMRNFYGCGLVRRETMDVVGGRSYVAHIFEHSGTLHGIQAQGFERRAPTLCFTRHAGGLSIVRHPSYTSITNMRVAVAGMGIGTLAVYGRPGDYYRFYEINPQVAALAQDTRLFSFISESQAEVDIVVEDARRALEEERRRDEEKWDVLIIDVYSGDAIPPHMSTKEAFQLYLDRLKPDGILSLHLTNWHLNLSPMVKAASKAFGLHLQGFGCWADKYSHGSYWTFLTRDPMNLYEEGKHGIVNYDTVKDIPLMTDERHSLLPYLSLKPMPVFDQKKSGGTVH
jgi:hypothetical protein